MLIAKGEPTGVDMLGRMWTVCSRGKHGRIIMKASLKRQELRKPVQLVTSARTSRREEPNLGQDTDDCQRSHVMGTSWATAVGYNDD